MEEVETVEHGVIDESMLEATADASFQDVSIFQSEAGEISYILQADGSFLAAPDGLIFATTEEGQGEVTTTTTTANPAEGLVGGEAVVYATEIGDSTTTTSDRTSGAEVVANEEAVVSEAGGPASTTAQMEGNAEGVQQQMGQQQGGEKRVVDAEGNEFPVNGGGLIYLQEGDGEGRLIQVGCRVVDSAYWRVSERWIFGVTWTFNVTSVVYCYLPFLFFVDFSCLRMPSFNRKMVL